MRKLISENPIAALFSEHPASVGENYFQHLSVALTFSIKLTIAGLAALIHAFLPCCFEKTASNIVQQLYTQMVSNRDRRNLQ